MTLDRLPVGRSALVVRVTDDSPLGRRLMELGLTPGTSVTVTKAAPLGDPLEIALRGTTLTLRRQDAAGIEVRVPPP